MNNWFRAGSAALMLGLSVTWTGAARADSETVMEKGGPSRPMLISGLITFGASYGAAALVGSVSDRDADHRLLIPFAGPWMALANRGDCGTANAGSCDTEATNKVLIIGDGVFQALGGLLIIGSFLNPQTLVVHHRTAAVPVELRLAPASFRAGSYGLAAVGTF